MSIPFCVAIPIDPIYPSAPDLVETYPSASVCKEEQDCFSLDDEETYPPVSIPCVNSYTPVVDTMKKGFFTRNKQKKNIPSFFT